MQTLLFDGIQAAAQRTPDAAALLYRNDTIPYGTLAAQIEQTAQALRALGLATDERVAIYLPKQPETVVALFGTAAAGGVFVPVNPVLKPAQVGHILRDCNVRILITAPARLDTLEDELARCPDLATVVVVGGERNAEATTGPRLLPWAELTASAAEGPLPARIDTDMAAILYTSGSTGQPKGVVLSHRNMVAGAASVAEYLGNQADDRLLAVLPFSFDYGLSQLTTAFHVGASVVLMDYLLPRDVIRAVERYRVTGLACVPPLWNQLARLDWPPTARSRLRYLTNSGGALPRATLDGLRRALPETAVFLMYGLTEAFRSTYLPPDEVARRPHSMGRAIPNAEIMVVRPDGSECEPEETGELVHRGALVAMGYWNDPARTAERFRPAPGRPDGLPLAEVAVWSGDRVRRDRDGFLYFVGRNDEMIKSSGYRISPSEVEEVLYGCHGITQAVAFGTPHPELGQAIVAIVEADEASVTTDAVLEHCRARLPAFMVPTFVRIVAGMPRNANGKIDRPALRTEHEGLLEGKNEAWA